MASNNQSATALLTEHFRFTPLTLLDEIINTVNELVYHAVNQLEKSLSAATPEALGFEPDTTLDEDDRTAALEETKQDEINSGIVQIESLLNATVDKDFDKFEIYTLRNILAVGHDEDADLAQWVCLDHYRHLKLEDGSAQRITPEAVQLQRRKLHETAKLNAMLREEEARNKTVIEQLVALLGRDEGAASKSQSSLAFLANRQTSQPMSEDMKHVIERLPQLRQYVAQLQHSLAKPPTRDGRVEIDTAATKRRAYLDTQAVKALNRQGIEADGTAVSSSMDFSNVTRETVQGLEAIVQSLGDAAATKPEG